VDFDVVEVNPLNKKEIAFSENYRKVPIYIDSKGEQITESNVIMEHIEKEFPSPSVSLENTDAQKTDKEWLDWSEKLVQGLPTVIYDNLLNSIRAFNYVTKTGNFSWFQSRMIKYSGAFIMNLVANKIQKREQIEDPKAFLEKMVNEWVTGLNGKQFMGGNTPSSSDIAVFGISRAVGELNAGKIFKANSEYWNWLGRMQAATGLTLSIV